MRYLRNTFQGRQQQEEIATKTLYNPRVVFSFFCGGGGSGRAREFSCLISDNLRGDHDRGANSEMGPE